MGFYCNTFCCGQAHFSACSLLFFFVCGGQRTSFSGVNPNVKHVGGVETRLPASKIALNTAWSVTPCGGGDKYVRSTGLIPVARALRDTPASHLEQRLELACQLVKQAYSECRNLDQIIKAILSAPLYRYVPRVG